MIKRYIFSKKNEDKEILRNSSPWKYSFKNFLRVWGLLSVIVLLEFLWKNIFYFLDAPLPPPKEIIEGNTKKLIEYKYDEDNKCIKVKIISPYYALV